MARRSLGRQFGWLWASYAVSAYGSGLGFGALPLIAVLVLDASPAQVSALSAVGPAVGALIALPLGPWVEFHRKRPVMIAMDLARFAVMMTIPIAYALGLLSFVQLLVVSAVVATSKIAFNAASGAYLKALVGPDDLLVANARFESTTWSSIAVGPPLGGAAIGLFGPVTTVVADALSYLLSALGITAIRGREEHPQRTDKRRVRAGELLDGWRHLLSHPGLRALYLNHLLVGGLIMSTEPLLAVLLLRQLGFPPWQYGLSTGIVLAQVTVGAKTNEIPAFAPLLDAVEQVLGSLKDLIFVADALHTQVNHATEIAARGAHLLIPVKGNQPTLFTQLKTLPWTQIPIGHQTRDHGHGRRETRTVKAITLHTPGGIGFPHAEQAIRITRTRTTTTSGKTTRETTYLTISLPAADAHPSDLQEWIRREWLIEALHHIRDVTFREDSHQARTSNGPAVMATLRNTAIGFHRTRGETNIARATRRANRRPHDLITAVTSSNPRTQ